MFSFACPGCGIAFSVEDDKAGKAGKCPKCSILFEIPGVERPANPDASVRAGEVEIKPCPVCHTRLAVEVGDLGQIVKCPHCNQVYQAERSSAPPSEQHYDDEDHSHRPRRRIRIYAEPPRSETVFTLVLIGLLCCPILIIVGTLMATVDLRKIKRGIMDPEGKGFTQAAQIVGFVGIGIQILIIFFNVFSILNG